MKKIKNNRVRALAAIIAFGILIIIKMITIVVSYNYAEALKSADHASVNLELYIRQIVTISSVEIAFYVIVIICFIMWFHRAYLNLERLGVSLKYAANWAVLSWFIPLVNLFIPLQMMQEISKKTQQTANVDYVDKSKMIWFWWILFISVSLYQFYNVAYFDVNNDYFIIYIGTTLGLIISLIIIIKLIKEINVYEMILFNRVEDGFEELEHLVE